MSTLRGNLKSISLVDVIQLLHVNRKSGKLFVSEGKRAGVLFIQGGEVVHAETPNGVGEIGAFEILEWESGEFEFVASAAKPPQSIRRSVPDLLMESARTADSRRRFRGIFPNLRMVPWTTVSGDALTTGLKLFPEDRRVIPFLDGFRSFLEVIATSEQSEVTVLQTCLTLKEAGRLQVLDPEQSVAVVPMKMGLFKRGGHVELSKDTEALWQSMGPYGRDPIKRVRLTWPQGLAVEGVTFVAGMDPRQVAIPKELMQTWGVPEGMFISVRPAP